MSFPLELKHIKQAKDLYSLRHGLMEQNMSSCRSVNDLERRLSIHLSILSLMGEADFSSTGSDAERFLFFTLALQSSDEAVLHDTIVEALQQLSDKEFSDTPIFDAFTLYPPSIDLMLNVYREREQNRAQLFSLWRKQGADLPAGLVNQAELQLEDRRLQYEVMSYGANHPSYGLDLFRTYYGPLLRSAGHFPLDETLLEPVLWGGLVRGDREASNALRRAVEQVSIPAVKSRLLRLMALTGEPEHLPVLRESFEQSPTFESHWWALTGAVDSVPHLILQLGQPAVAESAREDWFFLTGVALPRRPALMLVDEAGERMEPDPEVENRLKMVPDAHYAQSWWEAHRHRWGEERWIMGRQGSHEWLYRLCRDYAGRSVEDITDLLSLKLQRPLGKRGRWGWQVLRLEALETMTAQDKHAAVGE